MTSDMTLKDMALIAGISLSVLGCISVSFDIRNKIKNWNNSTNDKQIFLVRNWSALLAVTFGVVVMFSIVVGPVSQMSVLVSVMGGVLTSCALAGVLVLEVAGSLTDKILALLAQHMEADSAGKSRISKVLEAMHAAAPRGTDKAD